MVRCKDRGVVLFDNDRSRSDFNMGNLYMKNGDIVTVMTISGEFVGKLERQDASSITITDPKFITVTQEGGMGFTNGIAMTGVQDPKEVTLYNVSFVVDTNPEVVSAYRQAVSGLITKPDPSFKL